MFVCWCRLVEESVHETGDREIKDLSAAESEAGRDAAERSLEMIEARVIAH